MRFLLLPERTAKARIVLLKAFAHKHFIMLKVAYHGCTARLVMDRGIRISVMLVLYVRGIRLALRGGCFHERLTAK